MEVQSLVLPTSTQRASEVEEFQEVTGGQEKGNGFLCSTLVFFIQNKQKLNKKNPQTQNPISGDTRGTPKPDSLCGHHLGDGLIQEFQAMQDPVAEPWAAGIQTLRKEQGRKHTPYSESFQDPADKATSVSLPAAWQGGEGPPQRDEGHFAWRP